MEVISWNAANERVRPECLAAHDRRAAADLGDGMDPELYGHIEQAMWNHPLARRGLSVWALVDDGKILASFETWPLQVRYRENGSIKTLEGRVLGSGFVIPEARLAGHGRYLSGTVCRQHFQQEGLAFIYGISETSPKVYSETNAHVRPLFMRRWPAHPAADGELAIELISTLEDWVVPPLQGYFDIALTKDLLSWRLDRVALLFPEDSQRPIGARIDDDRIIWVRSGDGAELEILHFRGGKDTAQELLRAAQNEAHARGLARIVAWENQMNLSWLPTGESVVSDDVLMVSPGALQVTIDGWVDTELGHNL